MTSPLRSLCLSLVVVAAASFAAAAATAAEKPVHADASVRSATSMGVVGFSERVSDIMRRQAAADAAGTRPERDNEEKENDRIGPDRAHVTPNPGSPDLVQFGTLVGKVRTPNSVSQVTSAQTVGVNVTSATLTGTYSTGAYPPDNMGTVGPTQFVVFVNGRLLSLNKTTGAPDGVLNANPDVFFSSVVNGSYTSDPRIRYDRLTGRWFLIIINVSVPNRILLAVSDAASNGVITGSTTWTFFYIPIDTTPPTINSGCLADYPTLGLDANALYIGTNDFCSGGNSYNGTDAYVVRKTSILGAGPIVVTAFRGLASASGAGPYTPQGVDNYDPSATEGYIIGIDNVSSGLLQMRRVSNPGGTPSISANVPITVSAWLQPLNSPHLGNTRSTTGYLNCVDDRLFAAHIRGGQLWTAHNVGTTSTGSGTGTASRDGVRWYQLSVPAGSGTPTVVQSGLVFTTSASNTTDQRNFIVPSIMVTGQGHVASTFTTAGTSEYANAAVFGRLSSDAAGTMQATTMLTSSASAYNPSGDPGQSGVGRRWGDYSYVSLDPLDDMTMWTVSQFTNATNSYGVRVAQLLAPPPATPSALADITAGQSSVTLTLTGTSASGSGFFDPGADLASPARPFHHLAAAITNGAATGIAPSVTSATYLTPTTVQLVLNASVATANVGSEKYTVTITNPDGQTSSAAIVHVLPGGGSPSVNLGTGPTAAEGNSGTTPFAFPVFLSTASASPVVVRYQTSDGTATTADNDYVAATDSITIAAGGTSGSITVSVKGDTKYETSETFGLTITGATGATLGTQLTATGTITNDDPVPTVSVAASSVGEGNSGTTPMPFTVSLSNPTYVATSANWVTSDNSASTFDNDYVTGSGTVSIPAGSTTGSLSVLVNGDTKYENNESFTVTLTGPVNCTLGTAVATGTILNDDTPPTLSVNDVSLLEGNAGTTTFHFTVTLSAPSGALASVGWATADSTATVSSGDYASGSGTLYFGTGTTTQSMDVLVNGDTVSEPDEAFKLVLSGPSGATLAKAVGVGTIQNDDGVPLLTVADVSAPEGNTGTTPFTFTVSLSNPSSAAVSVGYQTADSSATTASGDYAAASGTLTIPAFATSGNVVVDVTGDVCGEPNETFTLHLSAPANGAIARPEAIGTIVNDDPTTPPAVAVTAPAGGEVLQVLTPTDLTWTATDSVAITGVDLLLSRDGGATFGELLASGVANTGTFAWTPSPPATTSAILQVVAHDAACNSGSAVSGAVFSIEDHVTGVDGNGPVTTFALGAVRPNPARGAVQFAFQNPREASVRLSVVDVQGREIALVTSGPTPSGRHAATWTGSTASGQAPGGLYFVRYQAGGKVFTKRFVLIH